MEINFNEMLKRSNIMDITEYSCARVLEDTRINQNDYLEQLSRDINIEKSTLIAYSTWFNIDGKYYYFKDNCCFRELLMGEIYRNQGINNVHHQIAKFNGNYGIISENFRKPNNEYIRFDNFIRGYNALTDILEVENEIKSKLTRREYGDYKKEKAKIMALDILFGQHDRHEQNVYFEVSENSTRLAPIFDNGLCLFTGDNYILYDSCFDSLFFDATAPDKYTLKALKKYKELLTSLDKSMSINLPIYYEMVEDKHEILIPDTLKQDIINLYDRHRKIIEKTLTLTLK